MSQERERTGELLSRALGVIPGATQTLSKGPSQFVQGPSPVFIERGEGARVFDSEGREYLDWPMALGPLILGHRHAAVDEAIKRQLALGITFTLPSPVETEIAERVIDAYPVAEMVRFMKSGSEAVSGAIRLARAMTDRELVVTSGYHGWHDTFAPHTGRSLGVPASTAALTAAFEFNEPASLASLLDERPGEVAAVILEPATAHPPTDGFLSEVAGMTRDAGALLIFDEIITGLRWARGGASEYYGVDPDIAVLGKALGNGMPIAAVCGPGDLMRGFNEIFVSGTHGGECLSLAAAGAVLDALADGEVIRHIWELGGQLRDGAAALIAKHDLETVMTCSGEAPRVVIGAKGSDADGRTREVRSLLQQELAKRRILYNGSFFPSAAHKVSDVDQTLDALDTALEIISAGISAGDIAGLLEGPVIAPAFRQA